MGDWYFDNNRNVSQILVDNIVPVLYRYGINSDSVDEKLIFDVFPEGYSEIANKKSVLSCLRDFGALSDKNKMTDITALYAFGKLSFEEFVLEALSKRNDSKTESGKVKPLVVLCSLFYQMYEAGIEPAQIYLDKKECAYYLVDITSYDQVNNDLVNEIVSNRGTKSYQGLKLDYLSIWYNKLNDTPYFSVNAGKLYPYDNFLSFYKFVHENGSSISLAPTDEKKNYMLYFENQSTGIIEIIPELPLLGDVDVHDLKFNPSSFINYIFGISKKGFQYEDYFECECFGIYQAFAVIPRIVIHKISFQSEELADSLWLEKIVSLSSHVRKYIEPRADREIGGYNKLLYGVPGCGKSFKVSNEILGDVKDENIFRTTFFLDYSNADFIGQLLPKTDGKNVTYEPSFGPFTKALKRAYETKEMVYLVVEEITRGNAAAIFGDLFQLLDRLDEEKAIKKGGAAKVGDSEYPITNNFLETYLGIEEGKVIIPSNLSLIATMNTSDQNVFPLDTAFKRRWDREKVAINWDKATFADKCIPYTDFSWKQFAESINNLMDSKEAEGTISEDKKLGPFFISESTLVEEEKRYEETKENERKLVSFTNNVVDYLYNDVTQFNHEVIFSEQYSYEKVYTAMIEIATQSANMEERAAKFLQIFANKIVADKKQVQQVHEQQPVVEDDIEGGTNEANSSTANN